MPNTLMFLADAAANVAAAGNRAAAAPVAAQDPFLLPTWLIAGGVIALVVMVAVLASMAAGMRSSAGSGKKGFAEMLCKQVWTSTDTVTREFAELLRQPPGDIVALRVTVRTLREHLSGPLHLVDQMHCHPPSEWPDYALFGAFSNWGSQLKSMGSQLADLQHAMTYPVVKEPVDKHRDAMLIHHYTTEQFVLLRGVEQVRAYASALCIAAKPHLGGGHGDHKDGGCPCCDRAEHEAPAINTSIQIVIPPLPEKPAPPPPPPAPPVPATCCCAAPRPCQCARSCACVCVCTALAPPPAKAPA